MVIRCLDGQRKTDGQNSCISVVVNSIKTGCTACIRFLHHRLHSSLCFRSQSTVDSKSMASTSRSFILWLHGLGDSGPANEPVIKSSFTSPQLTNTRWSFPSASPQPVTCNRGFVMRSWFDVPEMPITANCLRDESSLLKAVQNVHSMIDKEIAAGVDPKNVFICGLSQGGALTLASVVLYPKTLGGGVVLSGWVPFNSNTSLIRQITPEAKRECF